MHTLLHCALGILSPPVGDQTLSVVAGPLYGISSSRPGEQHQALSGGDSGIQNDTFEVRGSLEHGVVADRVREFRIPVDNDTFTVVGMQALPSGPRIHHMKLFFLPHNSSTSNDSGVKAEWLFGGYDGVSSSGCADSVRNGPLGSSATGVNVGKGTPFGFIGLRIHNNAFLETDRSGFKLFVTRGGPPARELISLQAIGVQDFVLPPRQSRVLVSGDGGAHGGHSNRWIAPHDATLLRIHGHFHARGQQQTFLLNGREIGSWRKPAGTQQQRRQQVPTDIACVDPGMVDFASMRLRAGDVLSTTCEYNTSAETAPVSDGKRAEDEMCSAFMSLAMPCEHVGLCQPAVS